MEEKTSSLMKAFR